MNLISKLFHTADTPATMADCCQIGDQIRAKLKALPQPGPRGIGAEDFRDEAVRLLGAQRLMETRAAMSPQDVLSYSADRATEAAALAAEIASTKVQRDHIAQKFQRLKDDRAQPLARLEAAATASAATIADLSAAHAKAKQNKADAQAAHIADGNAGTLDTRKLDAEVRRSADALDEERERLAAVNGRLQAIGAEIAHAEADADARTKELKEHIKSLEQSAQELTIDTAVGVYVLTLAHGLRDPYDVPKFDLKIHDARRVPFVSGRDYEVMSGHIMDFLRAQAAPTPEEWLADVRASGVMDFSYVADTTSNLLGPERVRFFNSVNSR